MYKKLKFKSLREEHKNILIPIKNLIPQWYKDGPTWANNKIEANNGAMKLCMPFLDSLIVGYTFVTLDDILVEKDEVGNLNISWKNSSNNLVNFRHPNAAHTLPIPAGHNPTHCIWMTQGIIKLPKGYSAVIAHPFNRFDLPFTTLSGVVDDFPMYGGNIPFFIKEGFEGVIPQGTPFAQIVPFKRENWKLEESDKLIKESEISLKRSLSVLQGWYKHNVWKRKKYE